MEFTKEPTTTRPGVRICFIRGPHGISIELLERDKKEICLGRAGQPAMQILPDCVPMSYFRYMSDTAPSRRSRSTWRVDAPCQFGLTGVCSVGTGGVTGT